MSCFLARRLHSALIVWAAFGSLTLPAGAQEASVSARRTGTFADSGGFYGATGAKSAGMLNALKASVDADINGRLRQAKEQGLINVVELTESAHWRGDLPAARAQLARWLARTELSLIDVLHLGEEHPTSAAGNLERLHDQIKAAAPRLPVYLWPSYPLRPFGKADGWLYDAYGAGYSDYRRLVFDFLRTGKPLIACIDGSGYSDIRSAGEQLMVCRELDIPVFYFAAESGHGGVNRWRNLARAALIPWRHFVSTAIEFQGRCRTEAFAAADLLWAEPIEVAGDEGGKIDRSWQGMGPATVFGFTRLAIEGDKVRAKGRRRAALDLPLWSVLPVENAELTLLVDRDPGAGLCVKRSRWGQADEWEIVEGKYADGRLTYALGERLGHEFRVRIELGCDTAGEKAPAAIGGYSLRGAVAVPPDRAVDLGFFYDEWRKGIRLRQELAAGLWRTIGAIDNAESLETMAQPALRGRPGRAVSVAVVEKFTSKEPLEKVVVRLEGRENRRNLGGSFALGASLDGKTILKRVSPDPAGKDAAQVRASGSFEGAITLDLSDMRAFDGCRTFFAHLELKNNSGIRANLGTRLDRLEIEAAYKKP